MASMSPKERALHYALRIKSTEDPSAEMAKIKSELNGLVYVQTKKHLSSEDKIQILKTTRSILAGGKRDVDGGMIVEAADNTSTLDIIDSVLNELEKE